MRIGTVREIKTLEFRVGLTPEGAAELIHHGHQVFVEIGAGAGIGLGDDAYRAAGATILPDARSVFDKSELIVKVKEPQPSEIAMLRADHTLFTYLHLAADRRQTLGLMKSGATAIAYETITDKQGRLPLLAPMSQVAGRMATLVAAQYMLKPFGGRGLLLPGVPGVGEKTAAALINTFGSIEGISTALDAGHGGFPRGSRDKLEKARDYLDVALSVVKCADDAPLPEIDGKLPVVPADTGRLKELGERWGLGSSLSRLASTQPAAPAPTMT